MTENTLIENDFLRAEISEFGAELQSVRTCEGAERLWNGNPDFWSGRAPILFPVAGSFREDRYELDGQSFPLGKHGFARNKLWEKTNEGTRDQCEFMLREKEPGFPFDYALTAKFKLSGSALEISYSITNNGDRTFLCSLGAHEAWATPGGVAGWKVEFERDEDLAVHPVLGRLLSHDLKRLAEAPSRTLLLQDSLFENDALVFPALKSREATLSRIDGSCAVRVQFPDHPYLLVWTKPGAPFICLEPWCNLPDFTDAPFDIRKKTGFIEVAPGCTETRKHVLMFPGAEEGA